MNVRLNRARTRLAVAFAAIAVLGLASHDCAAVVIGDFENGSLDGWIPTPGQGNTATMGLSSVAGVGNTLGDSSLAVRNDPNAFWGPYLDLVANGHVNDLLAHRFLKFDVTFRGLSGDVTGYAQAQNIAINDGTGAFIQRSPDAGNTQWGGPGEDVTRTLTYDLDNFLRSGIPYRQWLASNPTPSQISFWFVSQSGGGPHGPNMNQGQIYFDNIRLVPEPSSLALAGCALSVIIGSLVRRRPLK